MLFKIYDTRLVIIAVLPLIILLKLRYFN
jgi:hypothetical protein